MKKTFRKFAVLMISALALIGVSMAQRLTEPVIANIPFCFCAGDQQLPAGVYKFSFNEQDNSVVLTNTATSRREVILALPGDSGRYGNFVDEGFPNPRLRFDVINGVHVLAELRTDTAGVRLPEHPAVLAATQRAGSVATVASLR